LQRSPGVHTHLLHQAQRFGVGANQDVLAVVEGDAGAIVQGAATARARPPSVREASKTVTLWPVWLACTAAAMPASQRQ